MTPIIINGYKMRLKKINKDGTRRYHCWYSTRAFETCAAKVKTNGNITKTIVEHDHSPDQRRDAVENEKLIINEQAKTTNLTPIEIIREMRARTDPIVCRQVGSFSTIRQRIYQARKKERDDFSALDKSPMIIAGKAAETKDGLRFLLADFVHNGKRVIIYASDRCLDILKNSDVWTVDGTFAVSPDPFYQLLTIQAEISPGVNKACAFALLQSKEEEQYTVVFERMEALMGNNYPAYILSDLETAIVNAVEKIFPFSKISLCYFHMLKAWRSHLEKHPQTKKEIKPGKQLNTFWNRLRALVFFKADDISFIYALIKSENFNINVPGLFDFYRYIEEFYIYGKNGRPPRYHPELWSCFESSTQNIPKTSNHIEAYNKTVKGILYVIGGKQKAKMSLLVKKLISVEKDTAAISLLFRSSTVDPKVQQKQKNCDLLKNNCIKRILAARLRSTDPLTLADVDELADVLTTL